MKYLILTSFFAAFAFIAMPVSSANACDTCGCGGGAEHSHAGHDHGHKADKKPCTKCLEAKKHHKMTGEKKPCKKCAEAKAHYDKKGHSMKKKMDGPQVVRIDDGYNNKGSLILNSGKSFSSRASSGYNN